MEEMACNQKISEIHISRLEMNLMSSQIESKKLIVDWDLKLILSQVNNHPRWRNTTCTMEIHERTHKITGNWKYGFLKYNRKYVTTKSSIYWSTIAKIVGCSPPPSPLFFGWESKVIGIWTYGLLCEDHLWYFQKLLL